MKQEATKKPLSTPPSAPKSLEALMKEKKWDGTEISQTLEYLFERTSRLSLLPNEATLLLERVISSDGSDKVNDLKQSVDGLCLLGSVSHKAQAFFIEIMGSFSPIEDQPYGVYVLRLARNIAKEHRRPHPKAYAHCRSIFKNVPLASPEIYGAFLSLPANTPTAVDVFLTRALDVLPSQEDQFYYLKQLRYIAGNVARLLDSQTIQKGAKKRNFRPVIEHLFGNANFGADQASSVVGKRLRLLQDVVNERIDEKEGTLVQIIHDLEQVGYDVDTCIYNYSNRLKKNEDRTYYTALIDNMRDVLTPLELFRFAQLLYKNLRGKNLTPTENKIFERYIAEEMKLNTQRRRAAVDIEKIVERRSSDPVLKHVAAYYQERFPSIQVQPQLINLSEDNGAWYSEVEQAESFRAAKRAAEGDEGKRSGFLGLVVDYLSGMNILERENIALVGLACGTALPELELLERLRELKNPTQKPHSVHLYLFDINGPMIAKAAANCHKRRVRASVDVKDITKLSYTADLGNITPPDSQLIISLQGRTFYNLEEAAVEVLDRIVKVIRGHHDSDSRGSRSRSIVLIEGDKEKNMDYYRDPGSENMHLSYVAHRLNAHRNSFSVGTSSTYAAILSPDKSKVEFYFLVTQPISYKTDGKESEIPIGTILRVGESKTLQEDTLKLFADRNFRHKEVSYGPRVMSVLTTNDNFFD